MSGSGISWAICKTAPGSRQITTPAPHHSVFLQTGCPSCRPTNSVKALKAQKQAKKQAINDKLQGSVATYLRYGGFKSVNIWQSYKQEGRRLVHFVRLATTLLKDKKVDDTIHLLAHNYATRYSPI